MKVTTLHHVQVSCPPRGEGAARRFYGSTLGLTEVPKAVGSGRSGRRLVPKSQSRDPCRGGEGFPSRSQGQPAFLVDEIEAVAETVAGAGYPVEWDDDFRGYRRFYTRDRADNRVEILERE